MYPGEPGRLDSFSYDMPNTRHDASRSHLRCCDGLLWL